MQAQDILKSDVFFFVATLAVAVVAVVIAVAGIYAIKIMRDVRSLVKSAKLKYGLIYKFAKSFLRK